MSRFDGTLARLQLKQERTVSYFSLPLLAGHLGIDFARLPFSIRILLESVLLALVGGTLGCLLSLPLNGVATGTIGFTTFSEVAFEFRITGELLGRGMLFAVAMGVLGGLLPARMAARKPVLDALRAA